ncbi:MAG TPA: HD domain-containing phosphohydrolase [Anaerolineales bacterium]|nr:HD domain-containing phosphohydrolase [Anaerolineales bacterium]
MNIETVLIVEDNAVLREGLREMLSAEGFIALCAENGVEALEQMSAITPDLILSDISMPEMDGLEFFSAVRAHPDWVTIPFVFLTARSEKEDILTGKKLGAEDYLIKPLTRDELITAVRSRLNRSRQLHLVQLQQAYETSLTALANAIDLRDRYTRGHVERVTAYTLAIAEQLGWPEAHLHALRFGAILHDIGKIHVREVMLIKNQPLDQQEWQEIRRHPVNGAEMIRDIPYLAPAVPVVRHHHERWDGGGYPDGLAGDQIPFGARLVAVADSFDAMTTDRPYKPALSLEAAYEEIERNAGLQFDPAVVAAFAIAWQQNKIQEVFNQWASISR